MALAPLRVHYYGHIGQGTGYAVAAEHTCRALLRAGVELEIIPMEIAAYGAIPVDLLERVRLFDQRHPAATPPTEQPDIAIVHTLPLSIPEVWKRIPEACTPDVSIAHTVWEVFSCPRQVAAELASNHDAVWVPSKATRLSITDALDDSGWKSRIRVIPHACSESPIDRKLHDGADRPYRFYYIGAWTARKNPAGLLRAYVNAFTRADDVELRIHAPGATADQISIAVAQLGIPQDQLPRLKFSNNRVDDLSIRELHRWGDCFVTATRGEGWNLPCFDAMRHGNMIVTTDCIGSDDYLFDVEAGTSAKRVHHSLAPALLDVTRSHGIGSQVALTVVGAQGVTAREVWCDPDLVDLGQKMRRCYEGRELLTVNYDPVTEYGYTAIGKLLADELNQYR